MTVLTGKRILLVEDEFLVAAMAEDALTELGAIVIGPAYRIREGLALAATETLDGAVLDINIAGERSDGIAELLISRNIPFIRATGYGRQEDKGDGVPVIDKPYSIDKLANALVSVMDRQG